MDEEDRGTAAEETFSDYLASLPPLEAVDAAAQAVSNSIHEFQYTHLLWEKIDKKRRASQLVCTIHELRENTDDLLIYLNRTFEDIADINAFATPFEMNGMLSESACELAYKLGRYVLTEIREQFYGYLPDDARNKVHFNELSEDVLIAFANRIALAPPKFSVNTTNLEVLISQEARRVRLAISGGYKPGSARHNRWQPPERIVVDVVKSAITVDGVHYSLNANTISLLDELVRAKGEWVNVSGKGGRTRDLENLPDEIEELVEKSRGKGCRIPLERLR